MIHQPPSLIPGLLPRKSLSELQRSEMFSLLSRHFDGVSEAQFTRDLDEKNWVLEIRRDGRLVGFSSLLVREVMIESEAVTGIYSGDTIVAPEAWNSPALAKLWIAAVNALRGEAPQRRCYWLLLTSGFRTYRFLPVFWREFFPRYDAQTPPEMQRKLDELAANQYGAQYDRTSGLVRFPFPQRLHAVLAEPASGRRSDEHIAYFLARNPGHDHGDELACITEICETNLTAAGHRMAGQ